MMRFLSGVMSVLVFSAIAECFLPWWSVAVISFIVSLLVNARPGSSFLMGFLGVALLWLLVSFWHDVANDHILSTRMAMLFHLPNYSLFILVTVLIGGLVGGLSAWAGALLRPAK